MTVTTSPETAANAAPPAPDRHYRQLFIGGEWVSPGGTESIEVINSATEEVMGSAPAGTVQDAEKAVAAARAAFEGWSQTPVEERAAVTAMGLRRQGLRAPPHVLETAAEDDARDRPIRRPAGTGDEG